MLVNKPGGEIPLRRPGGPLVERENVIYILIDSSMNKKQLDNINKELKSWTGSLKDYMYGLLRVMRIDSEPNWLDELCSLDDFSWIDVISGSNSNLNDAISLLVDDLKKTLKIKKRHRPFSVLLFYGSENVCDYKKASIELGEIEYVNRYAFLMDSKVEKQHFMNFVNCDSNIISIEGKFGIAFHKIINHSCAFSGYDIGEPIKDARDQIHFIYGGPPYEAIFRIEDERVIVRKYDINSAETNVVMDILEQFPNAWKERKKFQSILMDFIPENRLLRNLILGCLSEGIVADIVMSKGYKRNQISILAKRLREAYGCKDEVAAQIVWFWVVALRKEIIERQVFVDIPIDIKNIDYGTNDWTDWD